MTDPQTALRSQWQNIQARTGKSLEEIQAMLAASGASKHGEKRSWLMSALGLGYGDANTVVHLAAQDLAQGAATSASTEVAQPDAVAALYAGNKAALRPLHDALMSALAGFGAFEVAPKKTYLSLRRNKQWAMVGPATAKQIEIGLNCRSLPEHPRLKLLAAGGMCQASTRIEAVAQIDADLLAWLRAAYDAA